ncbi:MAG: murein transglycosylase [Ignavibacteriales bacterium]|nr:MAG: murein transglycosylase [Ignavibacteriales bacterium]
MDEINLKITNPEKHLQEMQNISSKISPERKEKLAKAAKDFESLLTQMMLKSMNKTNGGMFGDEEGDQFGGDVMDTIFESEISKYMTESKSLGIAQMIYKNMTGEDLPDLRVETRSINKEKAMEFIKHFKPESPAVTPSNKSLERLEKYNSIIDNAAGSFGVDSKIIKSIILAESAANEKAHSSADAKGLMQLMNGTASDMGVKNVWDPVQNINGGTKYFSQLLRQYNGDLKLALAAYNAGPGNVDKYNGVPPFDETKTYVTRVLGYLNYFEG